MSVHPVANTNGALEWDTAAMPMPGEDVLGDRAVVACAERHILLAVIDGVGHGPEAAAAGPVATSTLRHSEHDADDLMPRGSCREIADRILQDYKVGSDDALVLVARYLGRK